MLDKLKRFWDNVLYGVEYKLSDFENVCLNMFQSVLDSKNLQIIIKHREAVSGIVRMARDKRVVFRYPKDVEPKLKRVAAKSVELHACTIKIVRSDAVLYCDVVFENGLLIGLEFTSPPSGFDPSQCRFEWVRLIADVNEINVTLSEIAVESTTRPLLSKMSRRVVVREVEVPCQSVVIDTFIERILCSIPDGFCDLLNECNGFAFPGGRFEGTRARTIPWPDENLVLVAENDEQTWALALRVGESDPVTFILDEVAASLDPRGGPFVEVLVDFAEMIQREAGG